MRRIPATTDVKGKASAEFIVFGTDIPSDT